MAGRRSRLSIRARRLIADEANAVLVSADSAWEITTKTRLGKLPGAKDVAADVLGCIGNQGFVPLEIAVLHAQRAGGLTGEHRDPFDRMLIAQAQLEDVAIISDDRVFDDYAASRIW